MLRPSDIFLIRQMQLKNEAERHQGWAEWYLRDHQFLTNFVRRHYSHRDCPGRSQDIVHDSFLIGFENISTGRYKEQGCALRAYLYGIAKNLIRGAIRLQSKEIIDEHILGLAMGTITAIDDKIDLERILTWVAAARYEQPWLNLYVINSCYTQGKSSQELSEELGTSATNIRVISYRSVNKIREDLQRHYDLSLSTDEVRLCLKVL